MCTSMTPAKGLSAVGLLLAVLVCGPQPAESSPQCEHYGGCRGSYPFLPAPPGKVPSCAKPGSTSCDAIEHYPVQLIRYLIEKWGYDFNTLLSDESRDEFFTRWSPKPYSPPSYSYGPPTTSYNKVVPVYYPQAVRNYTANAGGGYPNARRYKAPAPPASTPYYPSSYFSSLLPNNQYVPSDNWWNRYSRSVASKQQQQKRSKRQAPAPNGATQLCPTTSSYIMPRAALNNRGNWMYVVNINEVDDRYTQLVKSETCASNQCNGLCTIPNGYTSSCQQQYVQKRLVALEADSALVLYANHRLPVVGIHAGKIEAHCAGWLSPTDTRNERPGPLSAGFANVAPDGAAGLRMRKNE
ncbi:Hypothetical predicted protein [Cloeon dipterum]|uniref:Spaetzle domain-containing protein n=1 Tax=Cloeon dipterum TaxID=197152 RepID=A0A8S1CUT3_9INSE|nr:Hypothetical predicted protein [Cloeon dipterum]